jgi:hypothetical protein
MARHLRRPLRVPAWLVAAGLVVGATACTTGDGGAAPGCKASAIPRRDGQTLVVEGDPWSGYALFRQKDLLSRHTHRYRWVYVEQLCQDVRAADVTAGRADFEVTTLDQYLLNRPAGTVVGVIDQSRGADALVLNTVKHPDLRSVDDLRALVDDFRRKGTRPKLAFTGSSPSEMLLNELANTTDELRLTDFDLVRVDQSASAYRMLQDGTAALAVLWEPDTSAARAEGYTVALSSKDTPDSIVDVLVASDGLVRRHPEQVAAVVDAFYAAMDHYLARPAALRQLIADDGGLNAAQAVHVVAGIKLYGRRDADTFMNHDVFPLDQPRITQSLRSIGALLAVLDPSVSLRDAKVDGRFIDGTAT